MSMGMIAVMVLVVMTGVGLIFGFVLAYVNKKFSVEVNPLIHVVEDILPKGQCGACGFAGCAAYAEAVVTDPDVPPNLCVPGKKAVADQVAQITGKQAPEIEPRVAQVRCQGSYDVATRKYAYKGVQDCVAASLLQGGPKGCQYGCMGFGTCVKNCPFDALHMGPKGLPVVDLDKCTGCGKCSTVCPKHVIAMVPVGTTASILCNSHDKGADARKLCKTACIGCGICAKNAPEGAIKVENNLATVVDFDALAKCDNFDFVAKCPTGAIQALTADARKKAAEAKEQIAKAAAEAKAKAKAAAEAKAKAAAEAKAAADAQAAEDQPKADK